MGTAATAVLEQGRSDSGPQARRTPARRGDRAYALCVALAFAVVAALLMSRHELWRDEWQAWMIARDSGSLAQLWANTRYEGHPLLWHLLLLAVHGLSRSPVAMQVVHLAIGTAMVFVLLRWAPLPRRHRTGLAFGYLLLFEYTVISRNYSLGVLGLLAFCALWRTRLRTHLPLAATLFLMAQTDPMALLLVPPLGLLLLLDLLVHHRSDLARPARRLDVVASAGLVCLGLLLAYVSMRPPPDWATPSGGPGTWGPVLATVWSSWVAVPRPDVVRFWGTNVLDRYLAVQVALSVLLLVAGGFVLRRARLVLLVWAVGTAGLLLFFRLAYVGGARHHGFLLVFFVACLWLCVAEVGDAGGRATRLVREVLLDVVVLGQVLGLLVAGYRDVRSPFSAAEATAAVLESDGLAGLPVVAGSDALTSGVSGALDRPFFYAQARRWGTFVVWDTARQATVPDTDLVATAAALSRSEHSDVVLLLTSALGRRASADPHVDLVASVRQDTVVASEGRYLVYVYRQEAR